jgi:hypothetical protein
MGSALPSCPSPIRSGFRVFAYQVPGKTKSSFQDPLLGFGSSSEVAQAPSRRFETLASQSFRLLVLPKRLSATPPLRFHSLRRLLTRSSGFLLVELASLNRQRLQVFATSWRFILPRAYRPYSMPDPPLGTPSRAFFLPRSRTPFPAPLPS